MQTPLPPDYLFRPDPALVLRRIESAGQKAMRST
jgi:hypothetical protein